MTAWKREDVTHVLESDDSTRDTEVWFIDQGPYAGRRTSSNDLYWNGVTAYNNDTTQNSMGIQKYSNHYNMTLSFGGIRGSDPGNNAVVTTTSTSVSQGDDGVIQTDGFFNIANWNATTNANVNPNYNIEEVENFVTNINPGFKFRWKEDPNQTVYTIAGGVSEAYDRLLRHSPAKSNLMRDVTLGQGGNPNYSPFSSFKDDSEKPLSMAEHLSFNFTKGWRINGIEPALTWDPTTEGQIVSGLDISLNAINSAGGTTGGNTVQGGSTSEFILYM